MKIDVLIDVKTTLGEGPLWDVQEQRLYWIDSVDGRVFRATADGSEIRAWQVPQKIGSMALRKNGGAIVALARGVHFLDLNTGDVELINDPEPNLKNNRLNDGKVDASGRFLFGSMDTLEDGPNGALYRLDADLTVHKLQDGIVVSNGPCWSPDGKTFYFSDTWSGEIWAYDYDVEMGSISNRRVFAVLQGENFRSSDGSTVDEEGGLWNAQVYEGKLVRYAPDGTIDRAIPMPVKNVTSVMFGGENLDTLFVTSMARPPLSRFPTDSVQGGSVFKITGLGVRGLPEHRFAG